jgi:hypothetical protein
MRCTALALLFGRAVKRASRMVLKCAGEEDGLRSASLANTFDFLIDLRVFCTDFGVALHGRPFLNRTIDAAATHAGLIACDTGGRRRTSFSRSAVSPADWAVPDYWSRAQSELLLNCPRLGSLKFTIVRLVTGTMPFSFNVDRAGSDRSGTVPLCRQAAQKASCEPGGTSQLHASVRALAQKEYRRPGSPIERQHSPSGTIARMTHRSAT